MILPWDCDWDIYPIWAQMFILLCLTVIGLTILAHYLLKWHIKRQWKKIVEDVSADTDP
jgi:hypothetical protein